MKLNILVATGLVLLAGCKQQPAPANEAAATPATGEVAAEPVANTYPPDYKIDQKISPEDIKVKLAQVGVPVYRAKDDILMFNVEITNSGKSPLVSAGLKPVQLAINIAGPDGVDKAPGKRGVARAKLPLIVEGTKAKSSRVMVPVAPLLGMKVQAELVQEGVAWFGRAYKQPVLDLGTFQRCNGAPATLCDASGKPVATPTAASAATQ